MIRLANFIFLLLIAQSAIADEPQEFQLPPIVVEGTPEEALAHDPVLSSKEGSVTQSSGSGSILRDIGDQIALPITEQGQPGGLEQVRAFGRSPEDVGVQA